VPDEATKRCVLVIDDDDATLAAIAEILEDDGYTVIVASGGQQAWFALQSAAPQPDILLLDLMMPRGTGWGLLERMRGDPRASQIPVVVMSACGVAYLESAPTAAGHLEKPLTRDTLLAKMRSALS
jgi:putative two-component system response regulator